LAIWTQWLDTTLRAPVPHRQVVLTIPKRLRAYCLYRRRLLGEIARVAARTVTAAIRPLTGERDLAVGIVACPQTHGSRANWHPHLHLLVTDGGFRPDGTFVSSPALDTARLTDAFRRAVLRLFVRFELFDEDQAAGMLTWPHSGFHVHTAVWVAEDDRAFATRLARYCARSPVALERLTYDRAAKAVATAVTYRSDKSDGPTAGPETVDPLEFLARVLVHIPDKGHVTTRYYGWYANRPRGMRQTAAPTGSNGPPAIVPARPLAPTEASRRWATLLQQLFEVDPLECPSCHGAMRIVACITQPSVIDQIPPTSGPAPPVRRTPGRGAPHRRGPPRAGGRHAPYARSPTRRRTPACGPDAPSPRGDLRRGRRSHRRDGLALAGIALPTESAVPTALEAHERVGGHAATRQSVRVRAVIASHTQPTQIELPIPTQSLHAIDGIPEALPPSVVMNQRYYQAIALVGAIPVLVPLLDDEATLRALFERVDGVLVPGGVDMDPATYGEAPHERLGRTDPARDRTELALARWCLKTRTPFLGLCRGAQVLNVAAGGGHWQDLEAEYAGAIKHDYFRTYGFARDHLAHEVAVAAGSHLRHALEADRIAVNSMHHQGLKAIGRGLAPTAIAPDGLVEAVELDADGAFVVGVQWHPEVFELTDPHTRRLFEAFVAAAGGVDGGGRG